MPSWTAFGVVAVVLTAAFVLLARASARTITAALEARSDPDAPPHEAAAVLDSDRLLAGNVIASHGLLVGLLLGTIWATQVPLQSVGVQAPALRTIVLGGLVGIGLAIGNEAAAQLADRLGLDRDERLRELLAPEGPMGWLALLLVVLPLVAAAEELLFRGVLIGGLAAGFGFPVWSLAAVSSIAFGLGHGLQGEAGIVVTTGLGFALALLFAVSGSLAPVIIAHYVVNALEFLVNEGFETARPLG